MTKVEKSLVKCKFPGCDYRNKYPCGIKMHERVHYPEAERPYGCKLCKFRASLKSGLKRHLIVHSEETPYICSVVGCGFKSKHKGCLRSHKRRIHSSAVQEMNCSFEGCDFKTKHSLKQHIAGCHSKTRARNIQCPMCSKRFFTTVLMQKHLCTHTNEKPWRCSLCNFEAKWKEMLARHEGACHGNFRRLSNVSFHKCTYCDFTTRFRSGLNRHLISHSQDRPYVCTVPGCSFRAKMEYTLKNHMETHGSNQTQYPCRVGGCTFLAKNAGVLGYHHLTKHSLPFPCVFPDCKARFSAEVALISHQRFHDPDRPHQCNSCLHRYKTTSELNNHILCVHEKLQRFQCTCCIYSTSIRGTRNAHMKKVHGLDDILCNEPGCNFRSCCVEDLEHHRMTRHNMSRPFKCEYCPHRFGHSSNLWTHLRRKHGDLFQQNLSLHKGLSRRFSSEACARTFADQVSLSQHSAPHKVPIVMLSRTKVYFS